MSIDASVLHNRLLEMMKQFHAMCEENNLKYYIIGGTCLGAKRHNGFIPWDDDMDIGMPREDYDRLCKLAKNKFPGNLELRFYKNTPSSPFHFVKLVDNTTTLIEKEYLNYVEGLYIDIFPLDGAKNYSSSFLEKIRCNLIWFEKAMIMYHCMTCSRSNILKKILIFIAKHRSLDKMHNKIEKHMIFLKYNNSQYIANFYGAWKEKEICHKSIFGKPTLYKFEDSYFYGPERIDSYLKCMYGDYMKLPPVEDRVFKHSFYYLNLEEGFREYILRKSTLKNK